jgi:tRNA-dihydrouridine synthase
VKKLPSIIIPELPHGIPALLPGPMEGVMKPAIVAAFNALELIDVWMTPFIRITTNVQKLKHLQRFVAPFTAGNKVPVIVQLMTVDPEAAANTAVTLMDFPHVCGINLNFACPSRQVVRHGAGGAQLRNPSEMFKIVERIRSAIPDNSLSVKLRCGFDESSEIVNWIGGFNDCGVDFAVVHCRTVQENYLPMSENERLDRLQAVFQAAGKLPIVANGDIGCLDDAKAYLQRSGFAGLMVGRGLLHDPFLLQRLKGGDVPAVADGRTLLFDKILEISRRDHDKSLNRGGLLESARMIWGEAHPNFKKVLSWNQEEFKCARIS